MADLTDDILGFEKFKIDEQLFSLLNQLLGGYARLAFKAKKNSQDKMSVFHFENRFTEINRLKSNIVRYTYPEKVSEIEKVKNELKEVLLKEKAL